MAVLLSFVAAIAVGAGAGAIEKAAGAGTPAAFIPPRSRPRVGRPAYACGPGRVNALTLAAGRPLPRGAGGGGPGRACLRSRALQRAPVRRLAPTSRKVFRAVEMRAI